MKRMMRWLAPTLALLTVPAMALAQAARGQGMRDNQGLNIDVAAQAGLQTFTGEAARFTSPGVSYGVLAGVDVLPWLGGELSYQGAAYETDRRLTPGNADGIGISENGGQVVAKVGPQLQGGLQPYALGGLSLSALDVADQESAFGAVEDATLFKLPVGAGVDWSIPGNPNNIAQFTVGARATYNITLNSDAFPLVDNDSASNQLQTTLQVGARF